jgi:hypothetical protein
MDLTLDLLDTHQAELQLITQDQVVICIATGP